MCKITILQEDNHELAMVDSVSFNFCGCNQFDVLKKILKNGLDNKS